MKEHVRFDTVKGGDSVVPSSNSGACRPIRRRRRRILLFAVVTWFASEA